MKQWYTETDLCTLNSLETTRFPQDIRAKDCAQHSRGNRRLHCGVGMGSNNKPCYSPYHDARKSFRRGLEGFVNASSKPLLDAFHRLIKSNTSLIFIGDSTMRQKLNALDCEVYREEPKTKLHGSLFGILPCHSEYQITLPGDMGVIDMHGISMGPKSTECLVDGVGKKDRITGVYENARYIIRQLNRVQKRNVLVLANMGLWYNTESSLLEVIDPVLDWLVEVKQERDVKNVVLWHETMSQHWSNPIGSGYFYKPWADDQELSWTDGRVNISSLAMEERQVPHCCTAIRNTSYMADWRNDIVKDHLKMNNRDRYIDLIPFAEATR